MGRTLPNEKKIMKQMAEIAFDPEEKTADRLRAMDLLSEYLKKQVQSEDAYARLDAVLAAFDEDDASGGSKPF